MNFRNIMILVAVSIAVTVGAVFVTANPVIRDRVAEALIDAGKILLGTAIGVLGGPALTKAVQRFEERRASGSHPTIESTRKENP